MPDADAGAGNLCFAASGLTRQLSDILGDIIFKITGGRMNIDKLKEMINSTDVVEDLMMLGEKVFKKNDDAVCAVTYFIERAYMMGKKNKVKTEE